MNIKKSKISLPPVNTAKRDFYAALRFIIPSITGVTIFVIVPFLETIRRSFFSTLGNEFVGFANYESILESPAFQLASGNTAHFICVSVPSLVGVSLTVALSLRFFAKKDSFLGSIFRSSLLLPIAIPVASIVLLWKVLFDQYGLVNSLLQALSCNPVQFMDTNAAFYVLVFTYLWKNFGYHSILWLTGLDEVPIEQYEAAEVDGANAFQKFVAITLPNTSSTLVLVTILGLLNAFKAFREAFLVAGAYPHDSIYLLQHLFNNWFISLDLPRLTAAAVLISLILLGFIIFLVVLWERTEN